MTAPDLDAIEASGKRWHGEDHRIVQVRWEPYKPDGQRQMKAKGRWQEQVGSGDFWRWQNCERPSGLTRPTPLAEALAAPDPAPAVVEIDLRAVMMEQIEEAAGQSPWVSPEYMMNEIISDCCAFLREPRAPDPAAIREAALREAEKALRDWQDSLNTHRFPETAITVGIAADVILDLIQKGATE